MLDANRHRVTFGRYLRTDHPEQENADVGGPSPARVGGVGLGASNISLAVHCILCMCAGLYKYTGQLRSEEKKIIDTVDTVVN